MTKTAVYNLKGEKSETTLNSEIFNMADNAALLAQAFRVQRANTRQNLAKTKDRSEVSGGGRKPFKQKGTGNARAGSSRSPLWTGGGVTFGPVAAKNFKLKLSRQMRQKALKIALSQKLKENRLIILKDLQFAKISTKEAVQLLNRLPIEEGKILVVLPGLNAEAELSMANLSYLKIIKAENLNIQDLLGFDYFLTTLDGIKKIEEQLGKAK